MNYLQHLWIKPRKLCKHFKRGEISQIHSLRNIEVTNEQHQPDKHSQIHSLRNDITNNEQHDPDNQWQVDINNMLEDHQQKISQIEERLSEKIKKMISQIEERLSEKIKISQIEEQLSEKISQMIDDKLAHGRRCGEITIYHNAIKINQLQVDLKRQKETLKKIDKKLTKFE